MNRYIKTTLDKNEKIKRNLEGDFLETLGNRFKNQLQETIIKLEMLSKKDYEIEDLKEIISSIGIKLELFLKNIIFPEISSKYNLFRFIDELLNYGFSKDEVNVLHDLRKMYNNAKHEPKYDPSILEISNLITKVTTIIDDLISLDLGITNTYVRTGFKRIFWIAAWDHYIGGDTELHIILPEETNHWIGPPSLDMIYIEMSSWDEVKTLLSQVGTLRYGKELIPNNLYEVYAAEDDFLDVLVFEGHYKDLISLLSQYEKRSELIPGLMRHDDLISMIQACLLAAIDVITNTSQNDIAIIIKDIKVQAVNVYAIPESYNKLDYIIGSITEMLLNIEQHNWKNISGLKWLHENQLEFSKESARAINKYFNVIIDDRFTICIAIT